MTKKTNTTQPDAPSGEAIRIKKYPNRRLYNTQTSAYIVLDDIVDLVKAGTEFVIEDTKTGEDITRSILNQIIYEREADGGNYHFPLDVQKQLIAMYDDAYGQMMPNYLRESMNVFVNERDRMKETFQEIVDYNSRAMAQFNEKVTEQNMEVFNRTFEFFQKMSGMAVPMADAPKSENENQDATDKDQHLEEIQSEIDRLQERLKSLK